MGRRETRSIKRAIERYVLKGVREGRKVVIYPFGEQGQMTKGMLNALYHIQEAFIIDNNLSRTHENIYPVDYLKNIDCTEYIFLIVCDHKRYYNEIRESLYRYVPEENIVDAFPRTRVGKYSYGSLCSHGLVERVGAFSCFAMGCDVVINHAVSYISQHPFLYYGNSDCESPGYEDCREEGWYFPGVVPRGHVEKAGKIIIGNDVWLGRNVIITNGSNIGNGVTAAAGCVITKDVPDYAVVAGIPAKIIRYRYEPHQIEQLNKIAWWDWPDEKIRDNYSDFFGSVDDFIKKHGNT